MIPQKLYKYKPIDNRNIQNLVNEIIWIPKPARFNDPFDCNRKLHGKTDYFKSRDLYLDAIGINEENAKKFSSLLNYFDSCKNTEDAIQEIEKELEMAGDSIRMKFDKHEHATNALRENMGVLSLAKKNNNILMWSHYADSHKGMCLEFSTEASHYGCKNTLKNKEFTNKVDYSDNYPSIAEMKIFDQTQSSMRQHLFLQKATCWGYEEEWRLLRQGGDSAIAYPGKLTGIIFGAMADPTMVEEVKDATIHYKSKPLFYYSKMKKDQFGLDIIPESML